MNPIDLLWGVINAVPGAISQGVIWGIMALGVYITFKVLDFPDLTVDGSFALGGAVSAMLIVGKIPFSMAFLFSFAIGILAAALFYFRANTPFMGILFAVIGFFGVGGIMLILLTSVENMNPFLSLLIATFFGAVFGAVTGALHTKLKIPGILAGILSMIALYSINIRIMGSANTPLLGSETIVSQLEKWPIFASLGTAVEIGRLTIGTKNIIGICLGLVFAALIVALMYWFFGTEVGCAIRATGNNEYMVRALGGNTDTIKIIGLLLSNGLVALSGAMVAQSQGYSDVGMGTGTIVVGLASVIIGEVLFGRGQHSFAFYLSSVVLGSIVYRIIIAIVLQLGMKSTDLKLLTAIIVALALSIPVMQPRITSALRRFSPAKTGAQK